MSSWKNAVLCILHDTIVREANALSWYGDCYSWLLPDCYSWVVQWKYLKRVNNVTVFSGNQWEREINSLWSRVFIVPAGRKSNAFNNKTLIHVVKNLLFLAIIQLIVKRLNYSCHRWALVHVIAVVVHWSILTCKNHLNEATNTEINAHVNIQMKKYAIPKRLSLLQ